MKGIIVIGPPGSGKDTQVELLKKDYDIAVISTGDLVRDMAKKDPKVREVMESGALLDDATILAGIDTLLSQVPAEKMVVFDGFPRTMRQAEGVNEILEHHNRLIDAVVYIELDESVVVGRLSKRRVCSLCGINILPKEDKCSKCGGEPTQRGDDAPSSIERRVQTYLEETLPLVNYYENKGILAEINGDQPVEAVAADIKEKLKYVQAR